MIPYSTLRIVGTFRWSVSPRTTRRGVSYEECHSDQPDSAWFPNKRAGDKISPARPRSRVSKDSPRVAIRAFSHLADDHEGAEYLLGGCDVGFGGCLYLDDGYV